MNGRARSTAPRSLRHANTGGRPNQGRSVNSTVFRSFTITADPHPGHDGRAPRVSTTNYELYFYNEGTTTTRFHGWNRGEFYCLSAYACTQVQFSIIR